jgi:hypothetical protein
MTKFIDNWTFALNVDHIRKIEISGAHATVTYNSDQTREHFNKNTAEYNELRKFAGQLDDSSYHIIPAAPGYTLLTFAPDDGDDPIAFDIEANLDRSPVIAWHVYDGEPFGHQRAIAVDGDSSFHQENPFGSSAVLSPDGTVFAAGGYRLALLDAWVRVPREDWKQSRARSGIGGEEGRRSGEGCEAGAGHARVLR